MFEWRVYIDEQVEKAAREAVERQRTREAIYLYYRKGKGGLACRTDAEGPPPDFELACPERLPWNAAQHVVAHWIRSRCGNLPFLPDDR